MTIPDERYEDVVMATRHGISIRASELELLTAFLDASFPGLNLLQTPEYLAAIDAIRKYQDVAAEKVQKQLK